MLHCRSTRHLRRTRFHSFNFTYANSILGARRALRAPCLAYLATDASFARSPARTSGRDAVTPRPTKASDGRLPSMRITPGRQVAAVLRCTGSGLPSAGCQRSVTTRFPGQEPSIASTSFDRVHLHSAPRTERHAGQDDELLETDGDLRMGIVYRCSSASASFMLAALRVSVSETPVRVMDETRSDGSQRRDPP
jgi:hypothetical protein